MRSPVTLKHVFVDSAPDILEEGVIYVSIRYRSAMHRCCCGCGSEVVTPLSPTDWMLIFDGVSVSLNPSVGNWSLPCRSHYWIKNNKAHWASAWSDEQVIAGRKRDSLVKQHYYNRTVTDPALVSSKRESEAASLRPGLLARMSKWLASLKLRG